MNDGDLKKIGQLISDSTNRLTSLMDQRFEESEKRLVGLMDQRFEESEKRLVGLMDQRFEESEKRIMTEVGNFINDAILPQIADKADKSDIDHLESKMERIERKLDRLLDRNIEQDARLYKIESLPTVAHELRTKKAA